MPRHQGRDAGLLISQVDINKGQYVPDNMSFTTTRAHQELAGDIFIRVIIDEAHDPDSQHPFKDNVDLEKIESLITSEGYSNIAYLSFAGTVDMSRR